MSQLLVSTLEGAAQLLARHYEIELDVTLSDFLLPPADELGLHGRVVCDEHKNELFVGIQFGTAFMKTMDESGALTLQTLLVVAEEVSHFLLIHEAATREVSLTPLELEVQGEIDRFLMLLYWNALAQTSQKLPYQFKNLHEACDLVFTGTRFQEGVSPLYIDAEARAFIELKKAFSHAWDNSHFNFSQFNGLARNMLARHRETLLSQRFSPLLVSA